MENESKYEKEITLNGKIKFFNKDKGFGFIVSETNREYFFHVSNASKALFHTHEEVSFMIRDSKKGPEAYQVKSIKPLASFDNGKEKCNSCGKMMYPRVVFGNPTFGNFSNQKVAKYSICPSCGSRHKTFSTTESWGNGAGLIPFIVLIFILLIMSGSFR